MIRIILTYGLISGAAIILASIATITLLNGHGSLWLGYLTMLVGLSAILVGVRQYRNEALGGVIRFWPALGLGLAIAVAASLAYVAIWEVYLAATHYTFMDGYAASVLKAKRASGVSGAAYAKAVAEMDAMRQQYANPLYRLPMTFIEIFPVGVLVAIASAALLRNPRFLPAHGRPVIA
ncbi:MAG TPA: DUF4199 domain-containing protein [Phenylobacterium sp.]|jgi:hypothetical protein